MDHFLITFGRYSARARCVCFFSFLSVSSKPFWPNGTLTHTALVQMGGVKVQVPRHLFVTFLAKVRYWLIPPCWLWVGLYYLLTAWLHCLQAGEGAWVEGCLTPLCCCGKRWRHGSPLGPSDIRGGRSRVSTIPPLHSASLMQVRWRVSSPVGLRQGQEGWSPVVCSSTLSSFLAAELGWSLSSPLNPTDVILWGIREYQTTTCFQASVESQPL